MVTISTYCIHGIFSIDDILVKKKRHIAAGRPARLCSSIIGINTV